MAMIRAQEIHLGSPALIEHRETEKETTTALREIKMGRVVLKIKKGGKLPKIEISKVDSTGEDT